MQDLEQGILEIYPRNLRPLGFLAMICMRNISLISLSLSVRCWFKLLLRQIVSNVVGRNIGVLFRVSASYFFLFFY